jgi:predicted RNA-binding Zn-ribbon protein involved in translation (DUF1610 family)
MELRCVGCGGRKNVGAIELHDDPRPLQRKCPSCGETMIVTGKLVYNEPEKTP